MLWVARPVPRRRRGEDGSGGSDPPARRGERRLPLQPAMGPDRRMPADRRGAAPGRIRERRPRGGGRPMALGLGGVVDPTVEPLDRRVRRGRPAPVERPSERLGPDAPVRPRPPRVAVAHAPDVHHARRHVHVNGRREPRDREPGLPRPRRGRVRMPPGPPSRRRPSLGVARGDQRSGAAPAPPRGVRRHLGRAARAPLGGRPWRCGDRAPRRVRRAGRPAAPAAGDRDDGSSRP